jgi:hypothetical protein
MSTILATGSSAIAITVTGASGMCPPAHHICDGEEVWCFATRGAHASQTLRAMPLCAR